MAVPTAERAPEGTHVEDHLVGVPAPVRAHDRVAAVGQGARRPLGRRSRLDRIEDVERGGADEPDRLRGQATGGPRILRTAEDHRGRREDAPRVVGRSHVQGEQPSAVGVADLRHPLIRSAERQEHVEQARDSLRDLGRHLQPPRASQQEIVQVDLGGVPLVARGLLEVRSVGKDLPQAFLVQDGAPGATPPRGFRQSLEDHARIDEAQGFTGEVGVRREVVREVPLHVSRVSAKRSGGAARGVPP